MSLNYGYFVVPEWRLLEWQQAYPTLNVEGELQRMKIWLDSNPKRRKKNYLRFVSGWLCRENARVERQAVEARSYARVGHYEGTGEHASPERVQEVLAMIERQRKEAR